MCCKYKGLMKDRWKYWRNSSIAKVSVIEHGLRAMWDTSRISIFEFTIQKKKNSV